MYTYGSLASETMPDTVYSVSQNGTEQIKYSFDDLARLSSCTISPINKPQTYTYKHGGHGANSTTTQVTSVTADGVTTSYTYDTVGNITAIHKNNELYESYEYDALSQLTKVTTASGDVYEYTYSGGNITSVKLNGTTLKTYSYDNSEWADLLTGYNGDTITYDNIGNPLNYRNGMSFTWQNGRQLAGITKGTDGIAYTYNVEGLRISKTVNDTATNYTYIDGRLIGEKTGDNTIIYLYDESGSKYGFTYNGTTYYYNFNLQGDVIGIYDSSGNIVVEYTYDVWGKLSSVTGELASTIGQINPIRYRGYYYDVESGFYYLNSRYYDPEIGRFINADSQINGDILGANLYAYCSDNPVNRIDNQGTFWDAILDIGFAACSAWQVLKEPKNPANWAALAADLVCLVVPVATDGGAAVRAASKIDDVVDAGKLTKTTLNDGFLGSPKKIVLPEGTLLQRTGSLQGAYVAPAGIPKQMLALPYDKIGEKTTILQVQKDVEVLSGIVAPWFGQIGCGTQYILSDPVLKLIDNGSIKIME